MSCSHIWFAQLSYNEIFFEALRLGLRASSFLYAGCPLKLYTQSMFFSSLYLCKRVDAKEYRKLKKRTFDWKMDKYINYAHKELFKSLETLMVGYRKEPFNLHCLESNNHLLSSSKCHHLSLSQKKEIIALYKPSFDSKPSLVDGVFKIGSVVMRRDLSIYHLYIPVMLEYAVCKSTESFDQGFEIVYFLMFSAVIISLGKGHQDSFAMEPERVEKNNFSNVYTENELMSTELGFPPTFVANRFFGKKYDPFFLSPFVKVRAYDVIFKSFLKKTEKVHKYILKNKERQILPPEEIFFQLSKLCWSRGEILLALKYIQLARGEDKMQEGKIGYSHFQLEISLSLGIEGEKCRNSAKFPFLLVSKRLLAKEKHEGSATPDLTNLFPKFIDLDAVLGILEEKRQEHVICGESSDDELDLFFDDDEEEKEEEHFFRVPSLWCQGIFVVIGGKISEGESQNKKKSNLVSKFLRGKSAKYKSLMRLRNRRKSNEQGGMGGKKIFRKENDGELLDVMYMLGIISFLERDFQQLKKWIVLLSDLEFFKDSYECSPRIHLLFQVVANLFHFEWKKLRRKKPNYLTLKPILGSPSGGSSEPIVYVAGDGQVLPWAHRFVEVDGLPHRLVPILVEGLRVVHLTQNSKISTNPRKECLLKRITEVVKMASKQNREVRIIFMIGELDLRNRILNDVVAEGDNLHTLFSESYQIELLSDILVHFVDNVRNFFQYGSLKSVAICPVFPVMHILEKTRILGEKGKFGLSMSGCGNRIEIFNRKLEEKVSGLLESRKKNQKKSGQIMFLGGGWEKTILDRRNSEIDRSFDLGCASYVVPENMLSEKDILKELELVLNRYKF